MSYFSSKIKKYFFIFTLSALNANIINCYIIQSAILQKNLDKEKKQKIYLFYDIHCIDETVNKKQCESFLNGLKIVEKRGSTKIYIENSEKSLSEQYLSQYIQNLYWYEPHNWMCWSCKNSLKKVFKSFIYVPQCHQLLDYIVQSIKNRDNIQLIDTRKELYEIFLDIKLIAFLNILKFDPILLQPALRSLEGNVFQKMIDILTQFRSSYKNCSEYELINKNKSTQDNHNDSQNQEISENILHEINLIDISICLIKTMQTTWQKDLEQTNHSFAKALVNRCQRALLYWKQSCQNAKLLSFHVKQSIDKYLTESLGESFILLDELLDPLNFKSLAKLDLFDITLLEKIHNEKQTENIIVFAGASHLDLIKKLLTQKECSIILDSKINTMFTGQFNSYNEYLDILEQKNHKQNNNLLMYIEKDIKPLNPETIEKTLEI